MFDKLYIAPILSPEGYISVLEKRAAAGFILRFGGLGATARNKLHFDIGVKMPRLPFLSERSKKEGKSEPLYYRNPKLETQYHDRNKGAWSNKAKTQNLKRFMAAYNFLQENDLHTVEQLGERIQTLSTETNDLLKQMNALSAREKKLKE